MSIRHGHEAGGRGRRDLLEEGDEHVGAVLGVHHGVPGGGGAMGRDGGRWMERDEDRDVRGESIKGLIGVTGRGQRNSEKATAYEEV